MQVIFIHHSCFLVEVDDKVLIFDYFDGNEVNGYSFKGKIPHYEPDTKIYVFASHCHQDHYDMDVLRWSEEYKNIKYIFSKDIRISPNFLKKHGIDPKVREKVLFVSAGKDYTLDDIKITTLQSTDAGVGFYISTNGVSLFHAGDLADWRVGGVGELVNGKVQKSFRSEIKKLSGKPLNLAFVPMDPRLMEYQDLSVDYVLRNTDAEFVFPMHMWQDYSGIAAYKKKISNLGMAERVVEISRENQVFPFAEA